jgi:hypothetical protein
MISSKYWSRSVDKAKCSNGSIYSVVRCHKGEIRLEILRALGSVVGWGTMVQAGRSRVRFLMRPLDKFNWPNPSSRTMALGSTQPLIQMSTRNLPGVKGGRRVGLSTSPSFVSRLSGNMWEPRRLTTLWAFTACYRDSFTFFKTQRKFKKSGKCNTPIYIAIIHETVTRNTKGSSCQIMWTNKCQNSQLYEATVPINYYTPW